MNIATREAENYANQVGLDIEDLKTAFYGGALTELEYQARIQTRAILVTK